ncbi:SpoIIE family protein phosphatase [Streptomyces chitinivorans]|uniref:SpoIIE family protein phosphatase n=1 Tax=Streptomyces chitinivorans TaxID=1257027 RepID=A0ABW7HW64_9ACTN|nr:SpoIIE family protein phosphatase [Streptomyces chitinivorans]MDH2410182.1 SpoIIE family protein phosphatase [Streptomyces chitinivorans]
MTSRTDPKPAPDPNPEPAPEPDGPEPEGGGNPEDDPEELYENSPCGQLSTLPDGRIVKVNATLLDWLGYRREELVGRRTFSRLLSVGGRIYYETHLAPLLGMQGRIGGIALEMKAADGSRLPVLIAAAVREGSEGRPALVRISVFEARDRRAYETELLRARREAERERERVQQLATTLQRSLLPPALPDIPGTELAAHYHTASADEVGGDFYDLFPVSGGRWGFFLGDVSGKGAAAAAVTSLARYSLRAASASDPDPLRVLANLNTVLEHENHGEDPRFCTVVHGLLTPGEHGCGITLAGGGHPPALLMRADGTAEYLHTPGGQLVGVLPNAHFAATTVRLAPGDTLLLYTDGLTEARTAHADGRHGQLDGGRYGEEALLDFAAGLAPTSAAEAVTAVGALLEGLGEGVDDDTAVLALGVPASRKAPGKPATPDRPDGPEPLRSP